MTTHTQTNAAHVKQMDVSSDEYTIPPRWGTEGVTKAPQTPWPEAKPQWGLQGSWVSRGRGDTGWGTGAGGQESLGKQGLEDPIYV